MKTRQAALGFRVKSGWATSVLLTGSVQTPELCDSRVIELSDPHDRTTRQPYHAGMGRLETNAVELKRRTQSVNRTTKKAVAVLLQRFPDNGYRIRRAGLVAGSQINPDKIANPHIRAHALEGRLFQTTLETALRSQGVRCSVFTERNAYAEAANILGQSPERIKLAIATLGRSQKGPWRADQKLAALAAWVSLP
jgi:hypothetical protein